METNPSFISSSLHSSLVYVFLMGGYTVIYLGTVYLYCSWKCDYSRAVAGTVTVLYILSLGQMVLQWYYTYAIFVDNKYTKMSMFLLTFEGGTQPKFGIAVLVFQSTSFILADGLMIWRCFQILGRSLRRIALPLVLFIIEIALAVLAISFQATVEANPRSSSSGRNKNYSVIFGALGAVVAVTSVVTTLMIIARIYSTTQGENIAVQIVFKRKYKTIVDMLIQSSAIYSLIILAAATLNFLPLSPGSTVAILSASDYTNVLVSVVTGFAPTMMVTRVILSSRKPDNVEVPDLVFSRGGENSGVNS